MDISIINWSDKRKILLYVLYIAGITTLFVFIRFPGDAVRKFVENNVQRLHPDVSMTVQSAGLSPLLKIRLKDCTLYYQGNVLAQAATLDVWPSLLSILGRPAVSFKARLFDGVVRGRLKREKDGTAYLTVRFKRLKMDKMGLENYFSRYLPAGIGQGEVSLDIGSDNIKGELIVLVENGDMAFKSPIFGLNNLELGTVDVTITMDDEKVIIERFEVNGPQVSASLTGDIRVRSPYTDSVVAISGFLTPQSSLIAQLSKTFPVETLLKKPPDKNGFPVKISGTIGAPNYSMN